MRKLYQRLVLLYLISALLFVLLFAVSLYLRGRKENGYYLYQLLGAVDSNLEEAAGEYEEEVRHLSGEYTTYAREVAYILAREERMAEAEGLETLRELMDVGAISLFDEKGEVVVTTEESLQGSRVDPECMDGEEKTCVQVDEPDFWEQPAYFYVAVPVESPRFAAVRLDGDMEKLGLEIYYNGDRSMTEFQIRCYRKEEGRQVYVGIYTPDFVILKRKDGDIYKALLAETKGELYAGVRAFQDRSRFMETEFVRRNNEKFGYERFAYLYLEDALSESARIRLTQKTIYGFFGEEEITCR